MWSDPNKEVKYKNIDINSKLICLKIKLFRFVLKAINLLEVHSCNLFSSPGPKMSVCYCNHFGSVSFSHMALYKNILKNWSTVNHLTQNVVGMSSQNGCFLFVWLYLVIFFCQIQIQDGSHCRTVWENKYFLTETGNLVNPKLHINSHLNVSLSLATIRKMLVSGD